MDEVTDITITVVNMVRDCVGKELCPPSLCPETQINTLLIDSLKMIQIVFEIEVHFGIELPEHALFQVDTIRDLINLVRLAVCSQILPRVADEAFI